jgi:hypothetical protein
MFSTKEKALTIFRSGLNCAQSILAAHSEEFNIENSTALAITTGFGGGMERLQET